MLCNKERLIIVQQGYYQYHRQRATTTHSQSSGFTYDNRLQQTIHGWQHTYAKNEEPQCPAKESRSLGVSGIEHILNRCGIYHYAVGNDEIYCRSIDDSKNSQHDASNHSQQEHGEIGHHEVQRQHDYHQRCLQHNMSPDTCIAVVRYIAEERDVI